VIVRIAGEGQFELTDDHLGRLNEIDNAAVAAVEAGDVDRFGDLLARMHELVRTDGRRVDDDDLVTSQVILPPPDTTMAEAAADFSGDGLIPD
jgi:predicted transcriptional regulator